ncbi:hypothetical protein [Chitinophaga sp. LS1]|uniref:hypothetical protein n=1 Tax=Chitinophaga sp. LS1 TaxID=3051176 RepID=UPI002AABE07E|nr:hypothetical protein [Chitinophaga sp. LS1]WPV68147.1 hypothetical protein QQL36_05350 [Chitinophaga sp. LS1]
MSRTLVIALLSILLPNLSAFSQENKPQISKSDAFEEPENGASRILSMKNGNTLLFHFTPKKGIYVTVFDAKHHIKATTRNKVDGWKAKALRTCSLKGYFEINGQPVFFLTHKERKNTELCRLIFNTQTGGLTKKDVLAEVPGVDYTDFYGTEHLPTEANLFEVAKDPNSDNYAVAAFRPEEAHRKIAVMHFNRNNKEINKAYFELPKSRYNYLISLNLNVMGDQSVFLSAYAYSVASKRVESSKILTGILRNGKKSFDYQFLDYTDGYQNVFSVVKYHPTDSSLYLLTAMDARTSAHPAIMDLKGPADSYALEMSVIDPVSLNVKKHYLVEHPVLSKYVSDHLHPKDAYFAAIQDFRINDDNTITYLFERLSNRTVTTNSTTVDAKGHFSSTTHVYITGHFGDIGIMKADNDGKELQSFAIAKNQTDGAYTSIFNQYHRQQDDWRFRTKGRYYTTPDFYSYDMMAGYVIYNDYPENIDTKNEETKSKENMHAVSESNTVLASFDGNKVTKTYLFGKPNNTKENSNFCQLTMNTHVNDGKTLVTMMIEKRGREKKAYLVWVNL